VGNETQHRKIVAAELLTLVGGDGVAQGFLLLSHGGAPVLLEQFLESALAERTAARSADLIDQPVGREV
jgi:hypothetical protein